jgi:hypothetical protein
VNRRIFLSYRREDSAGQAGRVSDRLVREFGDGCLFMDVSGIPLGVDFVKRLTEEVASCDVLLAMIGPRWIDIRDENGDRRLDNPDDFVRIEIRAALQRAIPLIPILLDGTKIPKANLLPEDVRALAVRNGLDLRHASFHADLDRLVRELKPPPSLAVGEVAHTKEDEYADEIPDIRIADDTAASSLFESNERDKLLPLLERGRIEAWGRLGNSHPPLMKIPSDAWRMNYLVCYPAPTGGINQTFLKSKARHESTYYDVYLNRAQLERVWPSLWHKASLDRIPCTELLGIATAEDWDFTSHDSLHLLDLQDAMRQGGSDDAIRIWGRSKKWTSDELMRKELLEKIEPAHWREFFVHLHAAIQNDNFNTYSWTPDQKDFGRRGYVDIHVDRSQAVSWLRRDASSFRGMTKPGRTN